MTSWISAHRRHQTRAKYALIHRHTHAHIHSVGFTLSPRGNGLVATRFTVLTVEASDVQASRRERSFRGAALGDYDGEEGRADDVCGSNSGTSRDAEKQECCVLLLEERLPFFKNECVSCFFIAFTLRAFRRKTSRVLVMEENTSLLGEAYVLVCCQYPCCHLKRKNNGW